MTPILTTHALTKNYASGPALTPGQPLSLEEGDIYGLLVKTEW